MLQIYLNDHRAAVAGGLALAERLAANNEGTELGRTVSQICTEIDADARALDHIIEHLGLHKNPVKRTAAVVGERVGRLKLNGQVKGYSPLSRLLEIEGAMAVVGANRSLWRSLRAASGAGRIGDVDLGEFMERADSQYERLLPHHDAAAGALADPLRASR